MQTFLPYPNFAVSAMVLDTQRLGKQRLEARTLLDVVRGRESRWSVHPAAAMWSGYTLALMLYGDCVIREWCRRGYKNSMPLMMSLDWDTPVRIPREIVMPHWLGDPELHASHRANLLRKNPDHYGQFGWAEQPTEGYVWPEGAH